MPGRIRRHGKGLLAAGVVLAVLLIVGVPYAYIHWIEGDQPAPLALSDVTTSSADAGTDDPQTTEAPQVTEPTSPASTTEDIESTTQGATASAESDASADSGSQNARTYLIGTGSQAGYRVDETLAGQATTAVGRTDSVSGSLTVSGSTLTAAIVEVQVADITSDNGQRDRQFTGRIMETDRYPTATFTLTDPVALGTLGATTTSVTAVGDLTLHGVTQPVTVPLQIQQNGSGLAATGSIEIAYEDYQINNPSIGSFVSVGDKGTIEFLILAMPTP